MTEGEGNVHSGHASARSGRARPRGLAEGCFDGRAGLAPNCIQVNKQARLQPMGVLAQLV
jgi:hypothetical protein